MARTWQKIAVAIGRKTISLSRTKGTTMDTDRCNKGHFVVYNIDQMRFVIPLAYLHNAVFRELFKMSEEEFGLPRDGPIMLPCDAVFIDYILSLVRRGLAQDLEQASVFLVVGSRGTLPFVHQQETSKQVDVCG
ncbi:Auxin-responsive protein SAUR61 [Camellia lanceoleosa]|uniref:Auxin-responsive protein SAUR61 n=1 Tax=Camellia lanceoleosa TaxID=1840588 RepID=A0ACC0IQR5_9ERIC|nr:Auxin-responsive protein SAUR61 [Camellia lanceoleosa]